LSERAPARHRADLPPSTPLTGITTSISSVVGDRAATIGRGGIVVAVSSGLVAGMGLPAAAATTAAGDTAQTASIPLVGGALGSALPAAADVLASAPVTAPTKARISFEHSAFTGVAKAGAAVSTPASVTREVATISRSLARAAYKAATPATATRPASTTTAAGPDASAHRSSAGAATRSAVAIRTGTDDGDGTGDVTGGTTQPVPPVAPPADDKVTDVIGIAMRYLGIAYRYGGTTPRGFDCSGFTQYVFRQVGVTLPRTADQQLRSASRISRSQARAGDLVFFLSGGYAYHVGIYLGNGKMVDSPRRGSVVTVRSVYSSNVAFARV
jgi:peptidoglycan DL-endopeptidase CwlO